MKYSTKIIWQKKAEEIFTDNKYSRAHSCEFDGGVKLPMSSSPQVVALPYSDEKAVDPEEAFVAALSSCHMLFFLSLAAAKNFTIESYEDNAEGILSKNAEGKMSMTEVTLHPQIKFTGNIPTQKEIDELHHQSHEKCYIANSVKTVVKIIQQQF